MKHLMRITAVCLAAVILFGGAWQYRSSRLQQEMAQRIFRFHVIANSDTGEDQKLKLKIRDSVGTYLQEKLQNVNDLEDCVSVARENLTEIRQIAGEVIAQEGYDYPVDAMVAHVDFPVKTYGNYTFPKGNYQALEIVIGEGKGQNWWCVMYPNMCFSGSSYQVVDETSRQKLKEVLTAEEYAEMIAEGKVQVKLKYLEKLFPMK